MTPYAAKSRLAQTLGVSLAPVRPPKMNCSARILLSVFCLITFDAQAGKLGYQCLVVDEKHLARSGKLISYPSPLELGKRFAVERATGKIVKLNPSLWNFDDTKATVLSSGNSDNSFAAVYVSQAARDGVHTAIIQIQEFSPGTNKPFVVMAGTSIYSGICE